MQKTTLCVIVFTLIILFVIMMGLCGYKASQVPEEPLVSNSMFIVVEESGFYKVAYHKSTKVMYAISWGHYNSGTFTVMLNADGTPMLWEGEEDE